MSILPAISLRTLQPGDIGWIIHRHGVLYFDELGWNYEFEALVAEILSQFVQQFKPDRERAWIAEQDGRMAGSVFLVERSIDVAQLRCLLVEPWARHVGLGGRLVSECLAFARQARYQRVTLWTNGKLESARRLYERAGFKLVSEVEQFAFGHEQVSQNWELTIDSWSP